MRVQGKASPVGGLSGQNEPVRLSAPAAMLEGLRKGAYTEIGRAVEAVEDVVFLSDHEAHRERLRGALERLADTCALLDVIGWAGSDPPLELRVDLDTGDEHGETGSARARQDLGSAVRGLRRARGLSIEALAFKAGMHPTYLSQIERGVSNPSWEKLCALAKGFGIPLVELVRRVETSARVQEHLQRVLTRQ